MAREDRREHLSGCLIVIALIVAVAFLILWLIRPARATCPAIPQGPLVPTNPAATAAPSLAARAVGRTVRMRVTAYCPCRICCGRWADGMTASGLPVTANGGAFVAADPKAPFGTSVIVPGYAAGKPVPVLDRGGKIRGKKLDVFFPTHSQARRWGVRHLDVIVLPGRPGQGG